ncbi:MAG: hypothetical protein F4Y24_17120 [Gemmatimonadetes bacterium]|nr:hypothetical protein [Gemmatimonadota bacterium]MYG21132.1 hypothetical protein [Gemmatimonadota bacterium]MYJ38012.1 hypothetical protein [Gemmatimonadota bacterium]
MRRVNVVAVLAVLGLVSACGDPNFPPVSCLLLEPQTLHIGDTNAVELCFTDPERDAITVTAEAADPVVQVRVQGTERLEITGVSIGRTTVTVKATAAGETIEETFSATVENRPPRTLEDQLPGIVLTEDEPSSTLELTDYFAEPDGQDLAFTVVGDREDLFAATVNGSRLTVEADSERPGRGAITVTATDPEGASVSLDGVVTVRSTVEVFRDDFSSIRPNWIRPPAGIDLAIVDGRLRMGVRSESSGQVAYPSMIHELPSPVRDFEITANLENQSDDFWVGIGYEAKTPTPYYSRGQRAGDIRAVIAIFGADVHRLFDSINYEGPTNFLVLFVVDTGNSFRLITIPRRKGIPTDLPNYSSKSPWIRSGAPMDVSIKVDSMITTTVDGEVAHKLPLPYGDDFTLPNDMLLVHLFGIWGQDYVPKTPDTDAGFYDWLAVGGEVFEAELHDAWDGIRSLARLLGTVPVEVVNP